MNKRTVISLVKITLMLIVFIVMVSSCRYSNKTIKELSKQYNSHKESIPKYPVMVEIGYPSCDTDVQFEINVVNIETGATYTTKSQDDVEMNVPAGKYVAYAYTEEFITQSGYRVKSVTANSPLAVFEVAEGKRPVITIDFNDDDRPPYITQIPPRGESWSDYQTRRQRFIEDRERQATYEAEQRCLEWQKERNREIKYINSPDYKYSVFIEWSSERDDYALGEYDYYIQSNIKLIDNNSGKVSTLVPFKFSSDPKNNMQRFNNLVWRSDSKSIYFNTAGWHADDAIHICEIATKKVKFIGAGDIIDVVQDGEHAGYIRIAMTYFNKDGEGGRQFCQALISPDTKEVIRLNDEEAWAYDETY